MLMKEETLFTSTQWPIVDADCKKNGVIVLLKGKGQNIVELNGVEILTGQAGSRKIRFTKEHFCILNDSILSFYSMAGKLVSECDVGKDVYELFPYRQGVLCIYGDEGVFGNKLGKNRLNYVAPLHKPESFYEIALQNNLLYDALFTRYKPYACLTWETNELLFLTDQLKKEKTLKIPFDSGNTITFSLSHEFGVFIEEDKLRLWEFETTGRVTEYPGDFSYNTRAIFQRHEFLFLTVLDHEVRVFSPIVNLYV